MSDQADQRADRLAESLRDVPEHSWDQVVDNYDNMGLKPELLSGIYAYGFERPSSCQQRAIVPVSHGRDLIAQSQAGSGNTVALSISVLQKLDPFTKGTQALVLVPTRELAQQFQKLIITLSEQMNIECHACIGGSKIREDMAKLQQGIQIVVGTPGRVFDMIHRRALAIDSIKLFCLDEADELLSRGFGEQIDEIYKLLPQQIQVVLFSATIPDNLLDVAKKITCDPVRIAIKRAEPEISLEGIKQFYIAVEKEEWKLDTLFDLYETIAITQATVYCNSRRQVEWLAEKLQARDFKVSTVHDEMDQMQRGRILQQFRVGSSRVLISNIFVPRSDVGHVTLLIHYDVPTERGTYLARTGRGGRFGRKGIAISFATTEDLGMLREIEQSYNTKIDEMPLNVAYAIIHLSF
ncbi:DEAD-domain-containing protein [Auriculariales sp. MPI-PUGE-AT-0066]|nr:DEAD-domain-containing protein [Auriculariales sp. MPI-PUGE-AT-0066]